MARSSECTDQYAQKVFDNADIVRDAIFQQQPTLSVFHGEEPNQKEKRPLTMK
jgi:hypothetical protein